MPSGLSLPQMDVLLGITMDGDLMTLAQYSKREAVGVSLLIATSCLSLAAVLGLLILMGAAAWANRTSESKNYFFRSNVAAYFICLLVADLLQAIASIMNARWLQLGGVQQGQFCTTQAVLKQVSDVGSAVWSLVISAQTFCLLFYQLHSPRKARWFVLAFANGLVVMFAFLGPVVYRTKVKGDFYGISGYWCWITEEYDMARMTLDYMVLFLSSSLSFILYILVFFRLRGNIVVTGWHVRFRMLGKDESGWRGRQPADSHALSVAKQMILHPIAYTILFLPIAVLRLCEWTGRPVSFPVMMLCDSIFLLAGVVDVVLFCTIRRVIPVKEVAKALLTGRIFQTQVKSPTDTTWFIGSLETGEKGAFGDLSLPVNDDHFVLCQPKFEIITPPPVVLLDKIIAPTSPRQVAQQSLALHTEVVARVEPRSPPPKTSRTIPRKPLPSEPSLRGEDEKDRYHSPSASRRVRKLPPVPRGPRSITRPSVIERQEALPPYRPTGTRERPPPVSKAISTLTRSGSLDSVISDSSFVSDSTLLGSTDKDSSKGPDSPTQE